MAKKPKSNEPLQRVFIQARHEFTPAEWMEATRKLTRAMEVKEEKENAKKATVSQLTAEIKQLQAEINEAANNVRNGGEDRQVEAAVEFLPKKGIKIFYHQCPDNTLLHGKEIRREPMSQVDYEGQLPLEDEPTPPDKLNPPGEKDGGQPGQPAA